MELTKTIGFSEMSEMEMREVDGGAIILAIIAVGTLTFEVTLGGALTAIGTAWGLGTAAYQIYNAFKPAEGEKENE